MSEDIRWQHRFSNFNKALAQLSKFIEKGELNELEEQGLIKAFEYTYELAWNVLKDYLNFIGINELRGPRDVFREAFHKEIITNGEVWMSMIDSRNQTSHTYNEETADDISEKIEEHYFNEFIQLRTKLESFRSGLQDEFEMS